MYQPIVCNFPNILDRTVVQLFIKRKCHQSVILFASLRNTPYKREYEYLKRIILVLSKTNT